MTKSPTTLVLICLFLHLILIFFAEDPGYFFVNEEDLYNSYKQVRDELGKYSSSLLKKNELIVLNKIDLIDKKELVKKKEKFTNKIRKKVLTLSTMSKLSISQIKKELINYASK